MHFNERKLHMSISGFLWSVALSGNSRNDSEKYGFNFIYGSQIVEGWMIDLNAFNDANVTIYMGYNYLYTYKLKKKKILNLVY